MQWLWPWRCEIAWLRRVLYNQQINPWWNLCGNGLSSQTLRPITSLHTHFSARMRVFPFFPDCSIVQCSLPSDKQNNRENRYAIKQQTVDSALHSVANASTPTMLYKSIHSERTLSTRGIEKGLYQERCWSFTCLVFSYQVLSHIFRQGFGSWAFSALQELALR